MNIQTGCPSRALLISIAFLFGCVGSPSTLGADRDVKRPNVIIILADDLGWADVGFHGSPIETPAIDRIAREGVELGALYTAPVCTPTRVMLMTGRDPIRMGLAYEQINPWDNAGVSSEEHFMPESFRAGGYQTAMIGKWHLGHTQGQQHPNARGFDYYYGHLNTAIDYWSHSRRKGIDWQRNGESVEEDGYVTDLQAADAARVIRERDKSRPLFLYVAFNAPHNPMQAPEQLLQKYEALPDDPMGAGYMDALGRMTPRLKAQFDQFRRVYGAMVHSMDDAVGQVLKALDDEGIADDTIVLFMSDNGGFNIFGGNNRPLRGQKAQAFEGGIRVAAALRWPKGVMAGGSVKQTLSTMDIFPTLASATGVTPQNTLTLDGVDHWRRIRDQTQVEREDDLFFVSEVPIPGHVFFGVRHEQWKLVQVERPGGLPLVTHLFDIGRDPNEENDLAPDQPEIVAALSDRLASWKKLHPADGLRRHAGPHPGWRPPRDWAHAMLPAEDLRAATESDFLREGMGDDEAAAGVFIYFTPEERAAMREAASSR